ncbi:hypothetical protein JAAARDRAFT_143668 [Jaapia argillacea MUCL 33604]|uniref:TLC domain-containing protein n=1 Tax=Jaapia argillacea MUCL 33604 TaxID=933084 RepID=A0A067PFL0_9AGAM|nr:hypothetical protein JAAARDRAFT_143668 [Jaapia argillacea MUCL 33604]
MSISYLLDYSLPVVGIELCVVWILVRTVLEPWFMPRVFHQAWPDMDLTARRSLTNHVVSFALKVTCCVGAYSIWEILIAQKPFDVPIRDSHHWKTTNGDILAFCYLTVPSIYLFEIIYRNNISVVSAIHHIAAIIINILGLMVVISHGQEGYLAETEFKLILIYGTFEMIFEIFPHLAVMFYRIMRNNPSLLHKMFLYTAIGIFTGTFLEQGAIFYFYARVWKNLTVFFKATGPILHCCFMAAQIHGGRVCWQIARKMRQEVVEAKERAKVAAAVEASTSDATVDLEKGLSGAEIPPLMKGDTSSLASGSHFNVDRDSQSVDAKDYVAAMTKPTNIVVS